MVLNILEDNVEMLVMNMQETFNREYETILQEKFGAKYNKNVEASAKVIIQANMQ